MAAINETIQNLDAANRPHTGNRAHSLGEQTGKVADEVRELGNMALEGAGEALKSVKERGSQVVEKARERGHDAMDKGRERLTEARDGFETYVSENPFKTVLIAAGIGALIGYSMRNRN